MNAQAQRKVKLKVLEKGTEQPVIAATVVYADIEALQNLQGSVTNVDGLAELKIPSKKTYYYKISYVGFVPATGKIEATETEKTVYLEEDHLGLNEVVVTGSRTARPIKMSPVTTQVLGGKQLVEAGYSNLQQALQQETPGLNIQKVGFGNEISMQGLDARHVLFLMDGERMTGDMAGNLDYERFNLHAIDRIEIVKGASSTLYGSRAAGAVINLITKKTTKPLSIDAGVRYGQMNERNYKNPQPKDFLYMFEKNADRPNLQGWVSAGFKAGKVTSQTDAWYSSSDAFYMYQAENDKKVYTQEANPFLPHDITVVNSSSRPPMGIEGKEHITVSQTLYYDPTDDLSVLVYGSTFFMNTYDLIQDMTFSQARDWTAGAKLTYHVKDWFSVTGSLHADFYDRFKRHERIDTRNKDYESSIWQPRLTITSNYFDGHSLIFGVLPRPLGCRGRTHQRAGTGTDIERPDWQVARKPEIRLYPYRLSALVGVADAERPYRRRLPDYPGTGTIPRHARHGQDHECDCHRPGTPESETRYWWHCNYPVRQTQDTEQKCGRTRQGFILRKGVQDRYTG